jgi:hypothetical protein
VTDSVVFCIVRCVLLACCASIVQAYNKGFISGLPTLIADFGNLFVCVYMAVQLYKTDRGSPLEIIEAVMAYLHVILFYGQVQHSHSHVLPTSRSSSFI